MFKRGDLVAVLDDTITGKVIDVSDENVMIETDDGFPLTFHRSALIHLRTDQGELSKFSDIQNAGMMDKDEERRDRKNRAQNSIDAPLEVDLHINQLVASTAGLDNYDMLNLQIDEAKRQLEFAISKRFKKVVFIHGKGAGVLRTELEFLLKKYPVTWYDASFQKYGLGATEVQILQNKKDYN